MEKLLPTEKQIVAIRNLSEYLGEKPRKYRTRAGASAAIEALVIRVRAFDEERNWNALSAPAPYDFCF